MSESTLTIISPTTLAEAKELSTVLANANSMPAALKKSPADVLAIVMAGAELGLAPMQSIRGIMLIEGRPTLSADAMGALVKASPKCEYLQCTVTTDKVATFVTKRRGDPEPTTMSFTIEEATQAGLNRPTASGKPSNWTKFPKAMLRARAQSAICRLVYSDLMLGVYDPDELEPAPVEKHVDSTATEAPAMVEALKASLKAKRRATIVDVPEAKPSPPALETPADAYVEGALVWPPAYAGKTLAQLNAKQLEWCVVNATREAEKGGDNRELFAVRLMEFTDEVARRVAVGAQAAIDRVAS